MTPQEDADVVVLEYLRAHPCAADTLEGISEWWLERRRIAAGVETVAAAIGRLIELGLVEELQRDDSRPPLFRIAKVRA